MRYSKILIDDNNNLQWIGSKNNPAIISYEVIVDYCLDKDNRYDIVIDDSRGRWDLDYCIAWKKDSLLAFRIYFNMIYDFKAWLIKIKYKIIRRLTRLLKLEINEFEDVTIKKFLQSIKQNL